MKKLIELMVPVKSFAAMLFAGFVCLYIFGGFVYGAFIDETFVYSISFWHLIAGIGFSMGLSLLWGFTFSDVVIKKWSFVKREMLFVLLVVLFGVAGFIKMQVIFASPGQDLLLIVAGVVLVFVIVLSLLSEWYFRKTSLRYTAMLKLYQAEVGFE